MFISFAGIKDNYTYEKKEFYVINSCLICTGLIDPMLWLLLNKKFGKNLQLLCESLELDKIIEELACRKKYCILFIRLLLNLESTVAKGSFLCYK